MSGIHNDLPIDSALIFTCKPVPHF